MFTIDDTLTDLKLKNKTMVKVFFSMNNHQVATPEMMLEEARSYIMFFRESAGRLSSCIALHLLATGRKLFYVHSSNPFPEEDRSEIEDEALAFVEGLGALIDSIDFSDFSHAAKERWIEQHEIFAQPKPPAPDRRQAVEPQLEPVLPDRTQKASPSVQPPPVQQTSLPPEPTPSSRSYSPDRQQAQPHNHVHQAPRPPQPPPVQRAPQDFPLEDVGTGDTAIQTPGRTGEQDFSPRLQLREDGKTRGGSAGHGLDDTKPYGRPAAANGAAARVRQEAGLKAAKTGGAKPGKPQTKRETPPVAGVVSRDREALARLLTSF